MINFRYNLLFIIFLFLELLRLGGLRDKVIKIRLKNGIRLFYFRNSFLSNKIEIFN